MVYPRKAPNAISGVDIPPLRGFINPITIFLQQNGFSREASIYIQTPSNYSKYVTDVDGEKKIKRSILECGNIGVETEAQDIQFNIPELFVE